MSLGSFFRDYVYIPLGGNRRRWFLNILIVWFLTGLWHGASWNFVIWGLYFGIIVMVEKFTLLPVHHRVPRPLLHLYSLLLIVIGWGIFYFEDMGEMGTFYGALFGLSASTGADIAVESAIFDRFWLWIAAILFCMPTRGFLASLPGRLFPQHPQAGAALSLGARVVVSSFVLLVSVAMLVGATNNAFLYTRF